MFYAFSFYYLLDNYEILAYSFQQKLYSFIDLNLNSFNLLTVIFMFVFGFITSFSPCFVSVFPLVLSYINFENKFTIKKNLFILGILTSFLIMIFLSHFVNFYGFLKKIPLISSCFLLIFSLNLIKVINLAPLFYSFYSLGFLINTYNINSYITGFFTGLSIIPCNTSSIFLAAWQLSNIFNLFNFIIYVIIYLLGCFLPLLILFHINYNKININSKNNYIVFLINKIVLSGSASLVFIFSFLSLLKSIYN
uniref:Thiol:disulfide interchange protein n=1 Tax=Bostrychia simpliciuscula TaxID=324754 RepID=A0A1Z1M7S2_9FLOR|nr:thiol:disulfide interchange protein [Bostrychia simpliciuscula]ARW62010.1 thiol:disulfide interchange protein [Bostrychia simpliciuscula]